MAAPIVLISSCCDFDANAIVTGLLSREDLPEPLACALPDLTCYPWAIDTKYYTADAQICVSTTKTIGDRNFASQVQAILLCFDNTNSSFELVKSWLPFVKEIDPEIKLLITDRCTDAGRNEYLEWCIEYGFELVETDPDVDEDDDFAEPKGYKRCISALHAHTWPNLKLKNSSTQFRSPFMQQLMQQQQSENADSSHDNNDNDGACADATEKGAKEESESETKNKDNEMQELFDALGNEDPGDESFESLFERMRMMKEQAERLPDTERKEYAERVAVQFMRAMGWEEGDLEVEEHSSDEERT